VKEKLRIGLLIDDFYLPAWNIKMLEEIIHFEGSEIVLIVKNGRVKSLKKSVFHRLFSRPEYFLYNLYTELDRKIFRQNPDVLDKKNILSELNIGHVAQLKTQALKNGSSHHFLPEDIAKIRNHKIDILIKLGFNQLSGDIHSVSKYGIWGYKSDDFKSNDVNPSGFWDVIDNKYDTNINVVIFDPDNEKHKLLLNSRSQTLPLSVNRNSNALLKKASLYLPSLIRELNDLGQDEFFNKINRINSNQDHSSEISNGYPTNFRLLIKLFVMVFSYGKNKIRYILFKNQWILLFRFKNDPEELQSFQSFNKILPPKDRFYADPFIIKKEGQFYIFFEELIFSENKGFISVIKVDQNGNYGKPEKILKKKYHLSYPHLFEFQGNLFMIPETKSNKTIELYRCLDFPLKWQFDRVLIEDIQAVDATIIFWEGKYWLFTYLDYFKGKFMSQGLYLFWTDDPTSGNWQFHKQNPIIPDSVFSRPAGNIYMDKNKIFRPSQDCSVRYGYGIKINQIIKLTETEYEEVEVDSIYPDWNKELISTHTINFVENLTVIDAEMRRRRF